MPAQAIHSSNLSRSHESILAARESELMESADNRPKMITSNFPYLMERYTGIVHPWVPSLAERSDLVVGCYDMNGSQDPADADPNYDPQGLVIKGERRRIMEQAPPRTIADVKAQQATAIAAARREERARVEAELRAEYEAKIAAMQTESPGPEPVPAKPKAKTATAKQKVKPAPVEPEPVAAAPNIGSSGAPSIADQLRAAAAAVAVTEPPEFITSGPAQEVADDALQAAFAQALN